MDNLQARAPATRGSKLGCTLLCQETDIAYSPAPNARVTASGSGPYQTQRHSNKLTGPVAGPDFRPDAYQELPVTSRAHPFRHGSTEAEESTRQTFLVYVAVLLHVNRNIRGLLARSGPRLLREGSQLDPTAVLYVSKSDRQALALGPSTLHDHLELHHKRCNKCPFEGLRSSN